MSIKPSAAIPKADGAGSSASAVGANSAEPTSAADAALAPSAATLFLDMNSPFRSVELSGVQPTPACRSLDDVDDSAERELHQFIQGVGGHADTSVAVRFAEETVVGPGVDPDRAGTTAVSRQIVGMHRQRKDDGTVVVLLLVDRGNDVRPPGRRRVLFLTDSHGVFVGLLPIMEGCESEVA